jgi:hypothetical protein
MCADLTRGGKTHARVEGHILRDFRRFTTTSSVGGDDRDQVKRAEKIFEDAGTEDVSSASEVSVKAG